MKFSRQQNFMKLYISTDGKDASNDDDNQGVQSYTNGFGIAFASC